jgi:pimeloyl-ACP methyl ester carboxylesterase
MQTGLKDKLAPAESATKPSVEGRELIALGTENSPICGTYHRLPDERDGSARGRVGILFLNSLSLPRTGPGDSAVYWADGFAACGYPTFRMDLPGLGDSDGELPREILDFVNAGGFTERAAQISRELVDRFQLSGVVLIGHCAGAVSALFAGSNSPACKGLVLLDMYFHLKHALRPKIREKMSDWALKSRVGRFASEIYHRMKKVRLSMRGERPPENANFPLLKRWDKVNSTGLPILFLKAPARKAVGMRPRTGEFDYLEYILKKVKNPEQVTVKLTEGTDHSFANRAGKDGVRQQVKDWLQSNFPITQ